MIFTSKQKGKRILVLGPRLAYARATVASACHVKEDHDLHVRRVLAFSILPFLLLLCLPVHFSLSAPFLTFYLSLSTTSTTSTTATTPIGRSGPAIVSDSHQRDYHMQRRLLDRHNSLNSLPIALHLLRRTGRALLPTHTYLAKTRSHTRFWANSL